MIDENALISLIIERFDDLNHKVDSLKADMVKRQDQHEIDDKIRFTELTAELEPLKKAQWRTAGIAGTSTAAITLLAEVARQFFR